MTAYQCLQAVVELVLNNLKTTSSYTTKWWSIVNTNNETFTDQIPHKRDIERWTAANRFLKEDSLFAHRLFTLLPADHDVNLSVAVNSPTFSKHPHARSTIRC